MVVWDKKRELQEDVLTYSGTELFLTAFYTAQVLLYSEEVRIESNNSNHNLLVVDVLDLSLGWVSTFHPIALITLE